jgi:xylulokinase
VLANVRGAGLITHLALGHIALADVPAMVEVKATYTPEAKASALYAERLKEFVNLYEKTKGIHKRLNSGRLSGHAG